MNALIATGFCATSREDFDTKLRWFEEVWLPNVGLRDVVVVDNTDVEGVPKLNPGGRVRVIEVRKNLGHVESMLGQSEPKFCGWSMSWIIPALIAYSEGRDFIYFEADALAFGNWEKQILRDMETGGLLMAFGVGSRFAVVEQSLFYIKHEFLLEAIMAYMNIPVSDGLFLPEERFQLMARMNSKIGRHSLPGGRSRPLPYDAPAWAAQKFTSEELEELRIRKLI